MQLRELRESQNLTIEELGTKAGVPASTIIAIEEGSLTPSERTGIKLAKGLEVRIDAIEEVVKSYTISGEGKGKGMADRV